jgi:hypothetical protein
MQAVRGYARGQLAWLGAQAISPISRGMVTGRGNDACLVWGECSGDDHPPWPSSVASADPRLAPQIRAVWSTDVVTTRAPSGEKAAEMTTLLWPSSVTSDAPVLTHPDPCRIVRGRSNYPGPLGREGGRDDPATGAYERGKRRTCSGIPDLNGLVVRRCEHAHTVGGECCRAAVGNDYRAQVSVPFTFQSASLVVCQTSTGAALWSG